MKDFRGIISESIRKVLLESEQDGLYLKAYRDNDVDTAMRMVMQAAKAAMPNTKVCDGNGEPFVVYHGSKNTFNVFDFGMSKGGSLGYGMYFTELKSYAEGYSKNGTARPFYVNISKPISPSTKDVKKKEFMDILVSLSEYVDEDGDRYALGNYADIDKYGQGKAIMEAMRLNYYPNSKNDIELICGLYNSLSGVTLKDYLKLIIEATGIDGVIYSSGSHHTEYVSFSPSQIKSAEPFTFDDSGNLIPLSQRFDFSKNDIRY